MRLRAEVQALRGFTLVEMMVVMVLLGLMTTLALPAMQRWHDGVQTRARITDVMDALRAAAFAAGAKRQNILVDAASFVSAESLKADAPGVSQNAAGGVAGRAALTIALPAGWAVRHVEPAQFLATGLCAPGRVDFVTKAGAVVSVGIQGPTCAVALAQSVPPRPVVTSIQP